MRTAHHVRIIPGRPIYREAGYGRMERILMMQDGWYLTVEVFPTQPNYPGSWKPIATGQLTFARDRGMGMNGDVGKIHRELPYQMESTIRRRLDRADWLLSGHLFRLIESLWPDDPLEAVMWLGRHGQDRHGQDRHGQDRLDHESPIGVKASLFDLIRFEEAA